MKTIAAALVFVIPTLAAAQSSSTVPQAEILGVATLRPAGPHRVFAMDSYGYTGVKIFDGDTLEIDGTIPTNDTGVLGLDPSNRFFYISESIWTLGNRGTRQDMVTVYDASSLNVVGEIPLPVGRLIIDARAHAFDVSASGKYAFVYNMQPASSEVVVNLQQRKVASVIEIPGCSLAYAWGDEGFASVCGDGTLATVTLSAKGTSSGLAHSERFFDPENDPVFDDGLVDHKSGRAFFLSYTGLVYPVQLAAKPQIDKPWSLQVAAGMPAAGTGVQELAWRPGGKNMLAWNKAQNRLYALMHAGTHWTSKEAGTEVWILDIAARSVVKRIALADPANSIAVSQDQQPLLFTLTKTNEITAIDPETGMQKAKGKSLGGTIMWVPGF